MADKQPLRATFFAFKKREQSGVLFRASAAFVIVAIVLYAALLGVLFGVMGVNPLALQQAAMQAQTNPEVLERMGSPGTIGTIMLVYLVFAFVICVLFAAYEAACLRWLIRGEVKGLFGLNLDGDTWRVYGTYWAWLVFFFLGYLALLVVTMGVSIGLAAVLQEQAAAVLVVLPIAFFLVPIYFCTRFAPAAAASVAQRKFKFFDGWKVSSGRFWALFGSFFLLWLIYVIVAIGLTCGWLAWALGPRLSEILAASSDPTAASLAINQAMLDAMNAQGGMAVYFGVQVVIWIVAIFFYLAMFGINARAAQVALEEGKISAAPA